MPLPPWLLFPKDLYRSSIAVWRLLAVLPGNPKDIPGAIIVHPAGQNEQMVGKSVDILYCERVDLLDPGQPGNVALGPTSHGACVV